MASTSTNKQPLLIDRVFHQTVKSDSLASGSASTVDIAGTNASSVLLNCSANDGAIVEDIYSIARGTDARTINLYFSGSTDYLRADEATFIGQFVSGTSIGTVVRWNDSNTGGMPNVLVPVPRVGSNAQFKALYVPKGKVLWCTLQEAAAVNSAANPIIGAQGGFY